jgi:hypothetical protein
MALQAVTAIKAHAVSDDGSHVALAFATREGGEISIMVPAECLEQLIAGLNRAKATVANKRSKNLEQIGVVFPKTGMVTADLNARGVVLLIFDAKTDSQVAYGLEPEASKKIAAGLIQNADTIIRQKGVKRA